MMNYLLPIDSAHKDDWKRFKQTYKEKNLGANIGEAIHQLIKNANEEISNEKE